MHKEKSIQINWFLIAFLAISATFPGQYSHAGSYIFAGEANGVDLITHPIGYTGTGGVVSISVGIDPSSPNAADMVISVQNIIAVFNGLQVTTDNLSLGGDNNIPSGFVDFESVALHEFGHAVGLAHCNLASESGLSGANQNFTKATDGANNSWNLDAGTDGVNGSSDDIRGDDVNLHWFKIADNNPFTIAGTVDGSTYSRDVGDLPGSHNFPANADRTVATLLGVSGTEAIMQQGSFSDEAQRTLAADDVATFRLAMAGLDEVAGTADDYTVSFSYAGLTTSADIVLKFDNSQTGFAVTSSGGSFLGGHVVVTSADIYFNTGFSWFFNDVPVGNAVPVITGQVPLSTPEETALAITLNDLTVTDPDNTYPDDFTLSVGDGSNYSRVGNTITPDENYEGSLTVPATVNDGTDSSAVFNLTVTVTGVNDAPVITGQTALSTPEETALAISLNDLTVSDPDNAYPADFTLTVSDGSNYSRVGNTITPDADFNGTLTVPVSVDDGEPSRVASNTFDLSVTVTAVNDQPVITGQSALSTPEETALAITLSDLSVTDPDNTYPGDFTLSVADGPNYSRVGNTITPDLDFNGVLTAPVTVDDGSELNSTSEVFNLSVTVTAVNDPPVITGQAPLSTPEETALAISLNDLTVSDPDNSYPGDFTLSVGDGSNYSRVGNNITPDLDFNGALTVPVTVNDGSASSNTFNLSVSVTAVNDPPEITGQDPLSTPEETALAIGLNDLNVTDPDNAYPDDFTLTVGDGSNYSRVGNTITPDEDFNGSLTVPVTVNDGSVNSNSFNLSVDVTAVNDPPEITGQDPLSTPEETALAITLSDLSVTDPDNAYPGDFTLTVSDGSNYSRVGNTITPDEDFNGSLTVPVTVNDGAASSPVFNLTVDVTGVNDPPEITGQNPLFTTEEEPLEITLSDLQVTDPDNVYPDDFTLAVQDGSDYSRVGNTITPDPGFLGTLTVPVSVNDGVAIREQSNVFNLSVTVSELNPPVVVDQPDGVVACINTFVSLSVTATGTAPLSYQWRKDSADLPGETGATLIIDPASVSDAGVYDCRITNGGGSVLSNTADVAVVALSAVLNPPVQAQGVNILGLEAEFSCDEAGIEWYWENLTTGITFGGLLNPVHIGSFSENTLIQLTAGPQGVPPVPIATSLVLVSQNPFYLDPNEDGCNTIDDLFIVLEDWNTLVGGDPDGDGMFTLLDLLYISTQFSLPCNP